MRVLRVRAAFLVLHIWSGTRAKPDSPFIGSTLVMFPPLLWCATHRPEKRNMMIPVSCRLFFVGGDRKRRGEEVFVVE